MIVVDTNVISYFYLNSEYSELAEELFLKTMDKKILRNFSDRAVSISQYLKQY